MNHLTEFFNESLCESRNDSLNQSITSLRLTARHVHKRLINFHQTVCKMSMNLIT